MKHSDPDTRSVAELEEHLAKNPGDQETAFSLGQALFDRFAYDGGGEDDIFRMAAIVDQAPLDRLRYERAFLALLQGDVELAIQQIAEFGTDVSSRGQAPVDADELWDWIDPLTDIAPTEVYHAFADGLSAGWPDSPAVLTLRGFGQADVSAALQYFQSAVGKDPTYWVASYGLGDSHYEMKNWAEARDSYLRALESETAADIADIHFGLGWSCGAQKQYDEEAAAYRKCLDLDPDFPNARNNLGWSLIKAGKYTDAIPVLRESIARGKDGKRPIRNLARALALLGQYEEAIKVLQLDTHRGSLTSFSRQKIDELRKRQSGTTGNASYDVGGGMDGGSTVRAGGLRSSTGNSSTNDNRMQLDATALDLYRERFLARMPDFSDFTLRYGCYWDEERAYKEEISELVRSLLSPGAFEAKSDRLPNTIHDAVLKILTVKLRTTERPQNLLGWREADALRRYGANEKRVLASELGALLYETGDIPDRIDRFNTTMWPVFKAHERANPFARSRLIPTFFLMMVDPEHNITVRTDLFKAVSQDLMGTRILRNGIFTGAEYREILELSKTVYSHLERWGWCPSDMIDVHSFLWTAAWEYEEEDDDEVAEDEE